MLTANSIKFIKSLHHKKFRIQHKLFIAEGHRLVSDIMCSKLDIKKGYYLKEWEENISKNDSRFNLISEKEMSRISGLSTPQAVLALVGKPDFTLNTDLLKTNLVIALDNIQDPGNLGTIIRLADWFGIKSVVCSYGTVDAYSPKVTQATMGAIARVEITYTDIVSVIKYANSNHIPTYGTFLEGENIYEANIDKNGLIVMGNEGSGISSETNKLIKRRITIPKFDSNNAIESLNVAMAMAIVCSEFRRRSFSKP